MSDEEIVPKHLSNHHRDTLLQLFQHPTSHNTQWPDVLSLLETVGEAEPRPDGKFLVRLGGGAEVLTPPKHKDLDIQQVLDVRRMPTSAGYATVVTELEAKGKEV